MTSTAHDSAVQRLHAGRVEQDRLTERYEAVIGTSTELAAYARLQTAGDHVTAREAWLHWIDDEGYRGLDAGPFELLAERSGPRARPAHPPFRQPCLANGRAAGGTDLRSRLA